MIVVSDDNVSNRYEIPETITEYDGTEYTVDAIGDGAFQGNKNLTQITIPASVTKIGENAFAGCENLKAIYIYAENPIDLNKARTRADGSSVFKGVDLETCTLYVPEGSVEKDKTAAIWGDFKNIKTFTLGINDIIMDERTTGIYNLKGQKIQSKDQLQQGVYIVNGKKFIKK